MKKVILTESELTRLIKRIINEQDSNSKQVAGPFIHKVLNKFKYFIYQKGDKFYLYMAEGDETPTIMPGTGGDKLGESSPYKSLDEAKKRILEIFKFFDELPEEAIPRK